MRIKTYKYAVLAMLLLTFSSCKKEDSDGIIPSTDGQGVVTTSITDGPFPFDIATEANVTVTKIEVKTDTEGFVVLFNGESSYNLVNLTNGVKAQVNATSIQAGTYTEARITTSAASVTLNNGTSYDASGGASVYTCDILPALLVEEGNNSEFLFDVDLTGSYAFFGFGGIELPDWISSATFINSCTFNPQIRCCNYGQTGAINGVVSVNGTAYENADVSIVVNGSVIHTHTNGNGSFTFIGVTSGSYDVHCTTENGGSGVALNVVIDGTGTSSCVINI